MEVCSAVSERKKEHYTLGNIQVSLVFFDMADAPRSMYLIDYLIFWRGCESF